jgi:hypothetical protein
MYKFRAFFAVKEEQELTFYWTELFSFTAKNARPGAI